MERAQSPDVEQAARRLRRPRARGALVAKRTLDVLLAAAMLVALSPLIVLLLVLLGLAGRGWLEPRLRLGRDGQPIRIYRFRALPGGLGDTLERLGARELPVLLAILFGRLSFVGPRALAPGTEAGYTGPRRLMAPGLIGPGQRCGDDGSAARLDDAYVAGWSLWGDVRLLVGLERAAGAAARSGTGYGRK